MAKDEVVEAPAPSALWIALDKQLPPRCAGHLRRLFETIGVERKARDVGPSLGDLMLADIEERRQEAEAGTAEAADEVAS